MCVRIRIEIYLFENNNPSDFQDFPISVAHNFILMLYRTQLCA